MIHTTKAIGILVLLWISGCSTTPTRELEAQSLWESAESRMSASTRCINRLHQQHANYLTITRIATDSRLGGSAFLRLAELDKAMGNYKQARHNLEQALRADLPAEDRRTALMMMGDLMERHINEKAEAIKVYQQLLAEYPDTFEGELSEYRLKMLNHDER